MSYIGNQPPDIGAYDVESFDGGGTSFTLKRAATVSSVLLFIDGVRQTPTDAYTVSGVTLTTTATTPSGTDNVTVMFMGDVVDIGAPSSDTVSTATIQDDAVTAAKLANSINTEIAANTAKTGITGGQATAITANTAKVTNATHTGDVTGATALTIAADAVDIAMLSATGSASASTFLRGDNAWAAAGGDNTPAFQAYLSANFTYAESTNVLIEFDLESFDTDGDYDHTTNYRFTPSTAGKYFIYARALMQGSTTNEITQARLSLSKNGSTDIGQAWFDPIDTAPFNKVPNSVFTVVDMNGTSDYVYAYALTSTISGNDPIIISGYPSHHKSIFGAWKMIGL